MRITGGELNGRILVAVKGRDIRPTSSKVRQAVFNIIGNDISGFHIIDIFAGTGIMGIEALSRGGEWALFLDSSGSSIGLIKKNLEICGLADKGYIIKGDIGKGFIRHNKLKKGNVDLAFIDPPYGQGLIPKVLEDIVKSEIMADDSKIVTESAKYDRLPERVGDFCLIKTRHYGETKIDRYIKREVNERKTCNISWHIRSID